MVFVSDEPFAADLPPGSTLKRATPPSPVESKVSTGLLLFDTQTPCQSQISYQDDTQFISAQVWITVK